MIHKGDRIAVGLSGGKDSNLLLCALHGLKARSPVNFDIVALTVDPTGGSTDLSKLYDFTRSLDVQLDITGYPIFDIIGNAPNTSPCSLCANLRRGILASKAKELGCRTLALGHHRDDVIETVLLNLFYSGGFKCFHPNIYMSRTGINVIRPLVYADEKEIGKEAERLELPIVDFQCKYAASSRRTLIKSAVRELSLVAPDLPGNVIHALKTYKPGNTWASDQTKESSHTGGREG